MEQKTIISVWVGGAFLAIAVAGALYADKIYVAPKAPPKIIYTIKGPVVLFDEVNPGDLITAPNLGTIYYLNEDNKRVVFPDEQTFTSWYDSFSDVKTITQEHLENLPLSGYNATIRPGTYFITIETSSQVWLVGSPFNLHWLSGGEDQVIEYFGEDWQARLVDIPEYYFTNYGKGGDILGSDTYIPGMVVKAKSNGQYYLVTVGGQRLISEEGFKANRFQEKFVVEVKEPLNLNLSGPTMGQYEPRWSSPDFFEQRNDQGPKDIEIGEAVAEAV